MTAEPVWAVQGTDPADGLPAVVFFGAGDEEIADAPPVAEEARRFRGNAPIGGHDSGRESVGATVGSRRPLRRGCRKCMQADRQRRPFLQDVSQSRSIDLCKNLRPQGPEVWQWESLLQRLYSLA